MLLPLFSFSRAVAAFAATVVVAYASTVVVTHAGIAVLAPAETTDTSLPVMSAVDYTIDYTGSLR